MSVFNEEQFKEGLVSELNLYDLPSTQTSVKDIYYEEVRPLTQVSDDGPFDFRINGQKFSRLSGFKEYSALRET